MAVIEPGWLGPKYLTAWDDESNYARRFAIAAEARSGGSIPDWMHARLLEFSGPGQVVLHESVEVRAGEIDQSGRFALHLSNGEHLRSHRVWLATGTRPDAHAMRSLRPLLDDVATLQGLPTVDENLRLGPHRVFVMRRLATLALGPAAGNLWGAQRAAHRITRAITGVDLECRPAARPAERTQTHPSE